MKTSRSSTFQKWRHVRCLWGKARIEAASLAGAPVKKKQREKALQCYELRYYAMIFFIDGILYRTNVSLFRTNEIVIPAWSHEGFMP